MSDDWDPPDELMRPTRYPSDNLAIIMLTCETLGHDIRVLLGQFITEQSRLNIWFLEEVKGSGKSVDETLRLTTFGDEQTRLVYEAWKGFERALGTGRERVAAHAEALRDALFRAVTELVEVRS